MSDQGQLRADQQTRPQGRSKQDYDRDVADCNQAHTANETSRDAFLAVAHTAIFVAAVAFASDLQAGSVKVLWLGIAGLLTNVVGLLAQALSYPAASRLINARRAQLNSEEEPRSFLASGLNGTALWSFPASVLAISAFVLINLGDAMTDEKSGPEDKVKELLEKGINPPPRAPVFEPGPEPRVETGVLPSPRAPAYQPEAPVDAAPEEPSDRGTSSDE